MKITEEEKRELEELYSFFYNNSKIQEMKNISMHRGSNTYLHSFKVAKLAIKRALRHKNINLKSVLIGAILHDYYLYDWRVDRSKKKRHTRNHPFIAAENAHNDFDIPEAIQDIIKAHMWPFNFKQFPKSKEARIINLADDHVALVEALSFTKYKSQHNEKYIEEIKHLF